MALVLSQFSVGTTAALVGVVPPGGSVKLQPGGTTTVYVGNSSAVTTSNGFGLSGQEPQAFTLPTTSSPSTLWAIASASTTLGAAFVTSS